MSQEQEQVPTEVVQELQRVTSSSSSSAAKVKNPGRVAAGKRLAQRNKEVKMKMKEENENAGREGSSIPTPNREGSSIAGREGSSIPNREGSGSGNGRIAVGTLGLGIAGLCGVLWAWWRRERQLPELGTTATTVASSGEGMFDI